MSDRRLSEQQRVDWLQLILSENVGPATFRHLINHFGSAASAIAALPDLAERGGGKRPYKLCDRGLAEQHLAKAGAMDAQIIALGEPEYPAHLGHIDHAPPLLCVKGVIDLLAKPKLAIIGARNASAAGRRLTRQLAQELSATGLMIVSGMARGIDTAAHEAALAGGTIAVLAGGIDHIYPPENDELHAQIAANGVIASEMMPGYRPQARDFPRRNRIISGMCFGVVVVEAAQRSGSLITARLAVEQGREVFAIPGSPLDPRAAGTNRLIQQGAALVATSDDILEILTPLIERTTRNTQGFSDRETDQPPGADFSKADDISDKTRTQILNALSPTPVNIDDLARECGVALAQIHAVLIEMELAGRLTRHNNHTVSIP